MRRLRYFPFSPNCIFTEKTVDPYVTIFYFPRRGDLFRRKFHFILPKFDLILPNYFFDLPWRFLFSPSLFPISSVMSAMPSSLSCPTLTYLFLRLR